MSDTTTVPFPRVTPGLYNHYRTGAYYVHAVAVLDADGHGDPAAPRQVVYIGTRDNPTPEGQLWHLRSEADFVAWVRYPDGEPAPDGMIAASTAQQLSAAGYVRRFERIAPRSPAP